VKAGDVINGYLILEDFKVVGAGLSKWTFAERGGRQFFIKEFLRARDELTSFSGLWRLRLCYGGPGGVVGAALPGAAAASE